MIGTSPIEFEVVEVEATEGGNAELFRHLVNVRGGGRMEFPLISVLPREDTGYPCVFLTRGIVIS